MRCSIRGSAMSDRKPGGTTEDVDLLEEEARPEDAMLQGSGSGVQAQGSIAAAAAVEGGASEYQASLWGDAWRQLRRKPLFLIAAFLLVVFTVMAIAPGLFTNADPEFADLSKSVDTPSAGHL